MWSHYPWPDRPTERRLLSRVIQAYLDIFAPGRGPGRPPRELSIAQVYHVDCEGDTPLDEAFRRQALDLAMARGPGIDQLSRDEPRHGP